MGCAPTLFNRHNWLYPSGAGIFVGQLIRIATFCAQPHSIDTRPNLGGLDCYHARGVVGSHSSGLFDLVPYLCLQSKRTGFHGWYLSAFVVALEMLLCNSIVLFGTRRSFDSAHRIVPGTYPTEIQRDSWNRLPVLIGYEVG